MKSSIKYALVPLGVALIGLALANWYFSKPKIVDISPEEIFRPQNTPVPQIDQKKISFALSS